MADDHNRTTDSGGHLYGLRNLDLSDKAVLTDCKICALKRHCGADRFLYDCRHFTTKEVRIEKGSR